MNSNSPANEAYSAAKLRRGIKHFVFGRVTSALLGLVIFSLVARFLPLTEYGAYAAILSFVELTLNVGSLGIDWVIIRYLPEYRIHGSVSQLRQFVLKLVSLRLLILLVLATLGWLLLDIIANALGVVTSRTALMIYLGVVVSEGSARFISGNVFESLLNQGMAQVAQVLRNLVFVGGIVYMFLVLDNRTVNGVAAIELCASLTSLAISLFMLRRYFLSVKMTASGWQEPKSRDMFDTARNNYLSYLITLTYSQHTLVLMLSHLAGVQVVALYGFARNLMEYVRKYLPAQLFIGLIRPKILASYSQTGSFARLNQQTQLVYKLSLFVLLGALVAFVAGGEFLIHLIGGRHYGDAKWLAVTLLLVLIPFSHRIVLEIVVNTVHMSQLWTKSALYCALTLPLAWVSLNTGAGVYGLVFALFMSEIMSNYIVIHGLTRTGKPYRTDWAGVCRLLISACVGIFPIVIIGVDDKGALLASVVIVCCIGLYLLTAFSLKPFLPAERDGINALLKRRLFVW